LHVLRVLYASHELCWLCMLCIELISCILCVLICYMFVIGWVLYCVLYLFMH